MKKYLTLLIAVLLCLMLAGCETPAILDNSPVNIAFVCGIANGNPVFDSEITEFSNLPFRVGSDYAVIAADGTPSVVVSGAIPDFSDRGYTAEIFREIGYSIFADLDNHIKQGAPDCDEVDVAAAMSLGVRSLRDHWKETDNILLMYMSGISTSGVINLAETPLYKLDIEESAEAAAEAMDLSLEGIDVVFYCLGDTTSPQPALSQHERALLRDFYDKLCNKLGAKSVTFEERLPIDGEYDFPMGVSVMETERLQSAMVAIEQYSELIEEPVPEKAVVNTLDNGGMIVFDETSVAFLPDSCELSDKDQALSSLSYVIGYMKDHPDFELLVCGTTAAVGDEETAKTFSLERAQTISRLIEAEGISPKRLHVLGCGYSSCLYKNDRLPDGELDSEAAKLNRSVSMTDYRSDAAKQVADSLK